MIKERQGEYSHGGLDADPDGGRGNGGPGVAAEAVLVPRWSVGRGGSRSSDRDSPRPCTSETLVHTHKRPVCGMMRLPLIGIVAPEVHTIGEVSR